MAVTPANRARYRAVQISRLVKWVFGAMPERFKRGLTGWLARALFLGPDGKPHVAGEHVLADLREFVRPGGRSPFSNDPLLMARRVGRLETFERLINFLNLDERDVQQLMELDDGLE